MQNFSGLLPIMNLNKMPEKFQIMSLFLIKWERIQIEKFHYIKIVTQKANLMDL